MRAALASFKALAVLLGLVAAVTIVPNAIADTGGAAAPQIDNAVPADPADGIGGQVPRVPATTRGAKAKLAKDGRTAIPPASAPKAVKRAIYAANKLTRKPYLWGGGHARWNDRGYDCSGAISYALRAAGLIDSPGDAVVLGRLSIMERGKGKWITYYWNHQHGYVIIAGLRYDTSGPGPKGPRWRKQKRSSRGFHVRHPKRF